MGRERWEFWIDVGGTFTDCVAKDLSGALHRHKLLSSGVTKGRVGAGSSSRFFIDPARRGGPADFWVGWAVAVVGDDGQVLDRGEVAAFDFATGRLDVRSLGREPIVGTRYELRCALDAPVIAIRYLLGLPLSQPVPPVDLRLGTTRGALYKTLHDARKKLRAHVEEVLG